MNITAEDIANQRAVARAVLLQEISQNGILMRLQECPNDSRIDFRLDQATEAGWTGWSQLEVKCRWKKYDPFKISKSKLEAAFQIAQLAGVPLCLWVWFSHDNFARGIMVDRLDFHVSEIHHGKRPGNGEIGFEIPLSAFTDTVPVLGQFQRSPNSDK